MNLSILIPTVVGREKQFNYICAKLTKQIEDSKLESKIEIITIKDNKEMSIGAKRQQLYNNANGKFAVQIDDDDDVSLDYCVKINEVIESGNFDCIGYFENCLINGVQQRSVISNQYKQWQTYDKPRNGITYVRTPFFKTPIRTDICCSVGVSDMRFGEDHDFAIRVLPYLKKEHFIYRDMYYYRADSLTQQQHRERYGIHN